MKVLELFSGTASFSKIAKARGHETFTIDNNPAHNPDWCVDIRKISREDILERFGEPDIIWASPPCQHFSIACHKHWRQRRPLPQTKGSIELISHTIKLILDLFPKFWFLENPRGRLRFVLGKPFSLFFTEPIVILYKSQRICGGIIPKYHGEGDCQDTFSDLTNGGRVRIARYGDQLCLKLCAWT